MKKWYAITGILVILFIVSLVSYFSASGRVAETEAELLIEKGKVANLNTQIDAVIEELRLRQLEVEKRDELVQNYGELVDNCMEYAEEAHFTFYYASVAKQRYGVDDLDEYLNRWEWIEGAYETGEFDCSEMSAYLEWRLENEGYNTVIVAKTTPGVFSEHAWLLVETSAGEYMPVEATTYEIVYWGHPQFDDYFVYDYEFETIQEALEYGPTEFDWWNPD